MADSVAAALRVNRQQARQIAEDVGVKEVRRMLTRAADDLRRRLDATVRTGAATPTTIEAMQTTLAQVEAVTRGIATGVGDITRGAAREVAQVGASQAYKFLRVSQRRFGGQPLPVREAAMINRAVRGADASLLRRLALTETQRARQAERVTPEPASKPPAFSVDRPTSVLQRYTAETIGHFEEELQTGLVTKQPWGEVRERLVTKSTFLQSAPAHWAERIVRTETMGAYNRAGWEATREADETLGDMVKVLVATIDGRTGWDSLQVHGQIRRVDEAFEWAGGLYQHPPNRPNDREIVVPHRLAWPLLPEFAPRSDAEVVAAWIRDRRRGSPPPRPQRSTVPLDEFGGKRR